MQVTRRRAKKKIVTEGLNEYQAAKKLEQDEEAKRKKMNEFGKFAIDFIKEAGFKRIAPESIRRWLDESGEPKYTNKFLRTTAGEIRRHEKKEKLDWNEMVSWGCSFGDFILHMRDLIQAGEDNLVYRIAVSITPGTKDMFLVNLAGRIFVKIPPEEIRPLEDDDVVILAAA